MGVSTRRHFPATAPGWAFWFLSTGRNVKHNPAGTHEFRFSSLSCCLPVLGCQTLSFPHVFHQQFPSPGKYCCIFGIVLPELQMQWLVVATGLGLSGWSGSGAIRINSFCCQGCQCWFLASQAALALGGCEHSPCISAKLRVGQL